VSRLFLWGIFAHLSSVFFAVGKNAARHEKAVFGAFGRCSGFVADQAVGANFEAGQAVGSNFEAGQAVGGSNFEAGLGVAGRAAGSNFEVGAGLANSAVGPVVPGRADSAVGPVVEVGVVGAQAVEAKRERRFSVPRFAGRSIAKARLLAGPTNL